MEGLSNGKYNDGFFWICQKYGFLPQKDPLKKLPNRYYKLQIIIENMPINIKGTYSDLSGHLAYPNDLKCVVKNMPNYISIIKKEDDIFVIQALFRAYTFLASAYLLSPAYHHFKETGKYGKAEPILPNNIAAPLCYVANKLKVFPWQDYHYSYSLGNYIKKDSTKGFDWSNLDMAIKYSGKRHEIGFIMVHVDIVSHSPKLIESINETLLGLKNKNIDQLISGLKLNCQTMKKINDRRKQMWSASDPKKYNDFRIFIMGIKGNKDIFGNGVIYEGVSNEPKQYRGQTGAQDNIIPTEDIFTGLINYYPKNKLTEYLFDLRNYRPVVAQEFFKDLEKESTNMFKKIKEITGDKGLVHLLTIINEIYNFRNGHWQFVQKYIMINTKYDQATGGTPITTWIPNQLEAALKYMEEIIKEINISNLNDEDIKIFNNIAQLFKTKKEKF